VEMRLDLEDQVISGGEGPNIVEAWELKRAIVYLEVAQIDDEDTYQVTK
jgi:hypothetical protein